MSLISILSIEKRPCSLLTTFPLNIVVFPPNIFDKSTPVVWTVSLYEKREGRRRTEDVGADPAEW